MNVFVQLVRIGDTGSHESISNGNKSPKSSSIGLSNDIGRNAKDFCVPASRQLTSNKAIEFDSFWNVDLTKASNRLLDSANKNTPLLLS